MRKHKKQDSPEYRGGVSPEIHEHRSELPHYRLYGKNRRVTVFQPLVEFLCVIFVTFLLIMFGGIWIMIVVSIFLYAELLIKIGTAMILALLILWKPVSFLHVQFRFRRKLKRFCKKRGYTLEVERGFFASFRWNSEQIDFSVDTGRRLYLCCYLTRYARCKMILFPAARQVTTVTRLRQNRFTAIYGIKPKYRTKSLCFPYSKDSTRREIVRSLILLPYPKDVFLQEKDNSLHPIGSGEKLDPYTVFSPSGFLATLEREIRKGDTE